MKPHERASGSAAELLDDVPTLELLEEDGLLTPRLVAYLEHRRALVAELDTALSEFRNPTKRKRSGRVEHLRDEPTTGRDELAVFVLHDALGSTLANVPTTIGESGSGAAATRWVWAPHTGALGFLDRASLASIKRDRSLADRLVVLDPGKGRAASWADLWGLVAASSARVHYADDAAKSVARGTLSVALLELWMSHVSCSRDPSRLRVVREQLARAKRAAAAE